MSQSQSDNLNLDLPTAEFPDTQIRDAARQFHCVARLLFDSMQARPTEPPLPIALPLQVVAAMGIELYLKSLAAHKEYRPVPDMPDSPGREVFAEASRWGHVLSKLFDQIDANTQNDLGRAYKCHPALKGVPVIRDALRTFDDTFVQARYPFEPDNANANCNLSELVRLLDVVATFVELQPKQWRG